MVLRPQLFKRHHHHEFKVKKSAVKEADHSVNMNPGEFWARFSPSSQTLFCLFINVKWRRFFAFGAKLKACSPSHLCKAGKSQCEVGVYVKLVELHRSSDGRAKTWCGKAVAFSFPVYFFLPSLLMPIFLWPPSSSSLCVSMSFLEQSCSCRTWFILFSLHLDPNEKVLCVLLHWVT